MTRKKGFLVFLSGMVAVLSSGCSGRVPWVSAAGETREEVQETTANRLEAVQQLGELRIGISADYAPFAFQVQTEGETFPWAGADVELGRYIAKEMGVEAEFCEMGFEDCLAAVAEGSVDMVLLGMLPTSDRDTVMDYTDIYYEPGKQVVLIKEHQERKTLQNLRILKKRQWRLSTEVCRHSFWQNSFRAPGRNLQRMHRKPS